MRHTSTRNSLSAKRATMFALGALILASCSPMDGPVEPATTALTIESADSRGSSCPKLPGGITAIRLTPAAIVAKPSSAGTITVLDQRGRVLPACAFSWSTSASAIATVTGGNVAVSNQTSGQALLRASVGGKVPLSASSSLTIEPDPMVDTILVRPGSMILVTAGTTTQFSAEAIDLNGRTIWGYPVQWGKAYPSTNMNVSSTGLMSTTIGEGGTNYVQVSVHNAFNQTKVAINPGSFQVLCWDKVWLGWAVFGDCTLAPQAAGSTILMRFRVVDGLNQDIPNAGMNFFITTNTGSVSPSSLAAPTMGTEYQTVWTLGASAGENVMQAHSYFGGVGVHIIGQ